MAHSENKDSVFLSWLCIPGIFCHNQSRPWAMHLRRSAQRLKKKLKTDWIKLWFLVPWSCILQFYSQYLLIYPFTNNVHQILSWAGKWSSFTSPLKGVCLQLSNEEKSPVEFHMDLHWNSCFTTTPRRRGKKMK